MNHIGISCGFHDAAVSVITEQGNIAFAGHSERYSKVKHDKNLCRDIVKEALSQTPAPYQVHYYEKPLLKYLREIRAGQPSNISSIFPKTIIGKEHTNLLCADKIYTHGHHLSHAAAGFQTSPFNHATVVIIDAIGEFDTITIWDAKYDDKGIAQYKKLWSKQYPDSIGLFYSAMTKRAGLKPLDEEYILMGMAAYGSTRHSIIMLNELISSIYDLDFNVNLHAGLHDKFLEGAADIDIAASAQFLLEHLVEAVMIKAALLGSSTNLVYGGGVALNCLANRTLGKHFGSIWIMPNPGDAGSSLGAAALGYGKKLNWTDSFLGHNIPGPYPVNKLLDHLLTDKIVGVASGREEFGPRALGNRSLLADPRGPDIKDRVNEIKRRQKFRPFAPVILEEYVNNYFTMPKNWNDSRYMQVIAECKDPESFPAICHYDNTSRVQTVPKDGSGIRELLEKWFVMTGCPMLLNTSLNIRGEPMVHDRTDAHRFQKLYGVKVIS
jgi:carbamoyltransferase